MSRPRYSILPLQDKDGTWVYLFRDNDLTHRTNGGPVQYGVACHYDGEKRNWTKTLDPIEAIEICGDLNEQEDKLQAELVEQRAARAKAEMKAFFDEKAKANAEAKANRTKTFWDILGIPRG